jgi:hypothetical protein
MQEIVERAISEFPSRAKNRYFIWAYPPRPLERKSRKLAAAWIPRNALAYKMSNKLCSRNIFSSRVDHPSTRVDRFLTAVDQATIDAVLADPTNPWILFGKWLIRAGENQVDNVWQRLTGAIESGRLPYAAKVSTARKNVSLKDTPRDQRLICVYTSNFLWREDVRRARLLLWKLGFKSRLYYRPDVLTILELGSVAGTDFTREIFTHLRRHGISKLIVKHRYFG